MITARAIVNTEMPEGRWIIDQLLEVEGAMFFSGGSDLNKSILLKTLMIKLRLEDQTFLGFGTRKVNTVLMLQNENSIFALKDRFKKIQKGFGLKKLPTGICFDELPVDFNDDDSVDRFIKRVKKWKRVKKHGFPEVIIVDPISSYRSADENLAHKWQAAENNINKIRELGSAFILVHHPPGNRPEKLRGTEKMFNWVDTVITVKGKRKQTKREYTIQKHRKATRKLDGKIVRHFDWKRCMLNSKGGNIKCPPEKVRDILKKRFKGACSNWTDFEKKVMSLCNCGKSTAKKGIKEAVELGFIREQPMGKKKRLVLV